MTENFENPICVHITRGDEVESVHRGSILITDNQGDVKFSLGNINRQIFPRSAIKIMQALPSVLSGAPKKYGFDNESLALMESSHNGEKIHTEKALKMLMAMDLTMDALKCGAHLPYDSDAVIDLGFYKQNTPCTLHNNCSGKHCGMLALAKYKGWDINNYHLSDHPVQLSIKNMMQKICETSLVKFGIDGCSVPTWQMPMPALALGFAKIANPKNLEKSLQNAIKELVNAGMNNPYFVAGKNRHCTKIMAHFQGQVFAKIGAEGVYCASLPKMGLGIAIKCDDGNERAANMMLNIALHKIGIAKDKNLLNQALFNHQKIQVGEIKAVA